MKKIPKVIIISILLINVLGAAAYTSVDQENTKTTLSKMESVQLSSPQILSSNTDEYLTITFNDVSSFLSTPGEPRLPKMVKTFELPFGAEDISVQVDVDETERVTTTLEKQVKPAPALLPLTAFETDASVQGMKPIKDESIYQSAEGYPEEVFSYRVGCGMNKDQDLVTFVTVDYYPVRYYPALDKLTATEDAIITVSYTQPDDNPLPDEPVHDLVIIAPRKFSRTLQPLIDHKNEFGVDTVLKTTEEIYREFDGVDKPEQIKYFIKHAKEEWNIPYVLLVGGLKNMIWAQGRDDTNQGSRDWYLPVRYTNMFDDPAFPLGSIFDPGVISDLYFADLYKAGGEFSSWDGNGDGIFASLGKPGVDDDPTLDFYPDVALSRLPVRSTKELKTVIDKIINYEQSPADPSWFEKTIVVSGDGFLDQTDLNIQWNTNEVPDGEYTIYAQSWNPENVYGPVISINVTKDRNSESDITYSHDDHLNPAIQDAKENGFPTDPVAEIVSISEGDVLGNTAVAFDPQGSDYCNEFFFWANVSYVGGVLTIRGKSYDPKPYGNVSSIHVWVEDESGVKVFEDWRNNTEMYYEGEWTTGEKALLGRGGALYYMPDHFEKDIVWASNGRYTSQDDILNAIDKGSGFLFFSGHGSPNIWADQFPGIPGDRSHGGIGGIKVTELSLFNIGGVFIGANKISDLISNPFPMDGLSNGHKLPIAVVGGCHNSQFNVSMIPGMFEGWQYVIPNFDGFDKSLWCHGHAVPETFSWRLIRNPNGGAIASMGNTGLGYGMPGKELTTGGGDSWITIEFFKQYGTDGHDVLGDAYMNALSSYIDNFDMTDLSAGHPKTMTQWVLLGDPTLKIGGYDQ